jgi:hypothetical protein
MDRALAAFDSVDPAERPAGHFGMRAQRAHMRFRLNDRHGGIDQAAAAIADLERLQPADAARQLALSRVILGRMLNETGRPHDAEPILTMALSGYESLGAQHPQYAEALCELTRARLLQRPSVTDRDRLDECLPIYRGWGLAEREVVASLAMLLAPNRGEPSAR